MTAMKQLVNTLCSQLAHFVRRQRARGAERAHAEDAQHSKPVPLRHPHTGAHERTCQENELLGKHTARQDLSCLTKMTLF